ncbi:MAG TPA: hypothetical protein VMD07_00910 [Candidatus Acidoferrales bacterium]|nr:hypothetical protein [Candidatus Acidoferrales bacterium]
MSTLKESVIVQTPFAQAADLIERFFMASSPEDAVLTLHLSAPGAGLGVGGFALAHDVVVSFRRTKGRNQTIVFEIHWESADGGPYPTCDCTLTVAEDETYESCRLILEGKYTPPGWVAGAAFDAVLGSRIADATAKELLERMRSFLLSGYEETELAKRLKVEEVQREQASTHPGAPTA